MPSSDPIVLLHGFAGTGATWDAVRAELDAGRTVHTPDLRGHGRRSAVRPVSFAGCVADVLADAPPRFVLGGYSQGGRVALHVALAAPERVSALVLLATMAGLEDHEARAARRRSDTVLALKLQRDGLEAFAADWTTQPLFADDPPAARAAQVKDIARCSADGLAAALRGIGTGEMLPLWDRLGELTMPTTVLVGERDTKYQALGERLTTLLPDATLTIVPGAGHGLPREAPPAVAAALAGDAAA
ncbi:alpha/beta fold hydrolase [Paraconexibacter sp. AEG42_29]|uniref:alpha/beta fold hydrolase n=1 Tax=Paraconexibacter sp. AEG42_29 TaxID=2997339 RepID=UPI00339D92CA